MEQIIEKTEENKLIIKIKTTLDGNFLRVQIPKERTCS
jgi:hypothetical protein